MLVVSILEADDFGEELYPIMRESITSFIKYDGIQLVMANGDSKGMIHRLLSELAIEYPHVFFTIVLSNDKLAYDSSEPHIFSLDCDLVYGDPQNAKKIQRKRLIEQSDIVFCRKNNCNDIRKINNRCIIMAV